MQRSALCLVLTAFLGTAGRGGGSSGDPVNDNNVQSARAESAPALFGAEAALANRNRKG